MPQPSALTVYTVIVLSHEGKYLLLQRSPAKRSWPGLWTGIGGKVEDGELKDLRASALRELAEESGLTAADIDDFVLRRVLLHARPNSPLTLLLYFTGMLRHYALPACTEGALAWVTADEMAHLEIVGSTRPVLPLLIADCERDPRGEQAVRVGIAHFQGGGAVDQIAWA